MPRRRRRRSSTRLFVLLAALVASLVIASRSRPRSEVDRTLDGRPPLDSAALGRAGPADTAPTPSPSRTRAMTAPRAIPTIEERARAGERVAITATAYCLQGRTRRGNLVREGIVAADPKLFRLGGTIRLWIGRRALGDFLVDDTGKDIKSGRIDVWFSDCTEARRFGRRRGYAQLIRRGK
jgi:3D (Asp-Asp-Asp) domain-containing protein